MPACFLIVRRKPLQGQRFAGLEEAIESITLLNINLL